MSAKEALRLNVISTIENTLRERDLLPTDVELDHARILVPTVIFNSDTRTQTILTAHSSMRDLSVVFVRASWDAYWSSAALDLDNKAHMSVRIKYSDQEMKLHGAVK